MEFITIIDTINHYIKELTYISDELEKIQNNIKENIQLSDELLKGKFAQSVYDRATELSVHLSQHQNSITEINECLVELYKALVPYYDQNL